MAVSANRVGHWLGSSLLFLAFFLSGTRAQDNLRERTFPQPPAVVEKAVRALQEVAAGRLPVLDGFTVPDSRPLDHFSRGYYQCTVKVIVAPSGGSTIRVSAKITAWYTDTETAKSGYQILPSNGRLESDYLDRLAEALGKATATVPAVSADRKPPKPSTDTTAPTISAPMPQGNAPGSTFPSGQRLAVPPVTGDTGPRNSDQRTQALTRELKSLEEIVRSQSHPNNLVVVKESGTPVLAAANEGAKELFRASAEDEFEMLDSNASWVHIRISGLSRGWVRRSSVEMPAASGPDAPSPEAQPTAPSAPDQPLFQIENEEIASFPGDWEPLRGKTVRIVSLQKAAASAGNNSQSKQTFAKAQLRKEYADLVHSSSTVAGVVLIFDSADGGMLAATMPVLQEWQAGTISDEAMWRRCYFDPPQLFDATPDR